MPTIIKFGFQLVWILYVFFACQGEAVNESFNDPPLSLPYLIVLGIAQDAGFPQAGCRKDCCRRVWEKPADHRRVSCLGLVDPAAGKAWMLDATPDFKDQLFLLQQEGVGLAGIFLTHAHIGHYTGLIHLGREVMGAREVPVYAMPRMQHFLEQNGPWSQLVSLKNIDIHPLQTDSAIQLSANLRLTPFSVPHRDEFSETAGFRIDGPNRSALFIPDIDKWHLWERDIVEEIEKITYAFVDGTFYANGEIPGRDMSRIPHPFIEESMALFQNLPVDHRSRIHFIHFNHTNPVLQPGSEARKEVKSRGFNLTEEGERFGL